MRGGKIERDTDKLATVCNDNVRPCSRGLSRHIGITRREGEKKTLVWAKVCVCVCMYNIVWEKKKNRDRERVQETLIQRASVCSPRLSITLDSQGPFRLAVNHGPALPAHRLEAQDKPTAELHPVWPSSTAHSSATMGHSSHFSLQEDPVCQSSSNHQMCEWDGSLRPTWVTGKLAYGPADGLGLVSNIHNAGPYTSRSPKTSRFTVCQFCILFH